MNDRTELFTIADVLVTPSRNELEKAGIVLRLQPKVMEVLVYLARQHDRVVSKEELLDHVWPGRVVTDASVQKSVNLLRKSFTELLGEREIVTHYAKRGYQLQEPPGFVHERPSRDETVSTPLTFRPLVIAVSLVFCLLLTAGGYWLVNTLSLQLHKKHQIRFDRIYGYTNEVGHERTSAMHPDNRHVAYVSDTGDKATGVQLASNLLIRDEKGRDWSFVASNGLWQELSWSPSGRSLAVVELIENDVVTNAGFFSQSPNLYDIHIFVLDLIENQIIEKHRLSHWQGQINSITWVDEDTIELVAKQGSSAIFKSYHYSLNSQRLDIVPLPDFIANPQMTRVLDGMVAVASLHNGNLRIDLMGADGDRLVSQAVDFRTVSMSWIPDGSGVLLHSPETNNFSILYLDGTTHEIALPTTNATIVSRPQYSADGKRIFFTGESPYADIWLGKSDSVQQIINNNFRNEGAVYSHDGKQIAYISVRNNQSQIWMLINEKEQQIMQLQSRGNISDLRWTPDGRHLLYKAGTGIYLATPETTEETTLLADARDWSPLMINAEHTELLGLKRTADANNLWRVNLSTAEQVQLTFGSVGSALVHDSSVYFQYIDQPGLWRWRNGRPPEQVTSNMPLNSKLLHINQRGVFYVTGGQCRESSIFFFNFENSQNLTHLARESIRIVTSDFNPDFGYLFTRCELPESNIMVLE